MKALLLTLLLSAPAAASIQIGPGSASSSFINGQAIVTASEYTGYLWSTGNLKVDGWSLFNGTVTIASTLNITGTAPSATLNGLVVRGSTFTLQGANGLPAFTVDNATRAMLGNPSNPSFASTNESKESGYYVGTGGAADSSVGYRGFNIWYSEAYRFGMRLNPQVLRVLEIYSKSAGDDGQIAFRTGNDTEYMRLGATGNLGIGTASPLAKLSVVGDSSFSQPSTHLASVTVRVGDANTQADNRPTLAAFTGTVPITGVQDSMVLIESNDAQAAGKGGHLSFGGRYENGNTGQATWAHIKGLKADGVSGNAGGYLSFWTRPNGGSVTEAVRINETGSTQFGTGANMSTVTAGGFWQPLAQTTLQASLLAPTSLGQYIQNSTINELCKSTGTSAGNWQKVDGGGGCF